MKFLIFISSILFSLSLFSKDVKLKNITLNSNTVPIVDDAELSSYGYFIIQYADTIQKQDKLLLKKENIKIINYIPEDAYIVRASIQQINDLKKDSSRITLAVPYIADWKISNELQNISILDSANQTSLSVRLFQGALEKNIIEKIKNLGHQILQSGQRNILVLAPKTASLDIAKIQGVEWIQEMPQMQTFDFPMEFMNDDLGETKTGYESGTKVMNFEAAHLRGYKGSGQTAAMADTGLDSGAVGTLHPDLKTVIGGEPVALLGTSWADPQGHGTHVTGSVVGQGVLSNGLIMGGAYQAQFFAQGMWSDLFNNIMVPQDLKQMFASTYNRGARIHTNSWGTIQNLGSYDNFSAAVDEYMYNNKDFLILFAAGNSGEDKNQDGVIDPGSVSSPGTAKNALTVGASENYMVEGGRQKACGEMRDGDKKWGVEPLKSDKLSDNINGVACFSSRGPTNDQRLKPEIVAPGTNIVSLRSKHPKATRLWGIYNDDYSWAGGTSMATPLAAGAAAVTREFLVKNGFSNPSSSLVKAVMIHNAKDLFPGQFGVGNKQEMKTKRPNNVQGYGLVDMDKVTSMELSQVRDEKNGVGTSESFSINYNLNQMSEVLRITMVYTDAPAAASASKTLINNLDLVVSGPNGQKWTLNDSTNNSEMIEIFQAQAGTYKVEVIGRNVPMNSKQPFSLVVSKN